jgi:hypothetical protein
MSGGALDRLKADLERATRVSWQASQTRLRELFVRAGPPDRPLDGSYDGELLLVTVRGPLGALTRAWTRGWMPWKGKRFRADLGLGDNRFTNDVRLLTRAYWPFYHHARRADAGHFSAFTFSTRFAPSVIDPSHTVFRIDYDLDENPHFVIRDVVDEVVEVDPGVLLGEAQLRFAGRWRTVAYFALRPSARS